MKKPKPFFLLLIFFICTSQTTIPTNYYGINAWMPDFIGSVQFFGNLGIQWTAVSNSGPKIIRMGGIASDKEFYTNTQLLTTIDQIRLAGAEPVVQVPLYGGTFDATNAASIVTLVNVTNNKGVKYWSIGNEPWLVYNDASRGFVPGSYTTASLAAHIKAFSTAMKAVDSSIKIIAGDLSWLNEPWINRLIDPTGANGTDDVSGKNGSLGYDYIDIFSFHNYPFSGGSQTRATIISSVSSFETMTTTMRTRVNLANNTTNHRNTTLKFAVAETNINTTNPASNLPNGVGSNSFIAGQWWADIMLAGIHQGAEFLSFWSTVEGGDGSPTDNGYISHTTGKLKPTYYHFQLCTQNMTPTLYTATDNQANVKVYAAKDVSNIWAVMIINYEEFTAFTIRLRLENAAISGSETLKINVDGSTATEITETVSAESTTILKINSSGSIVDKITYTQTNANNNEAPQSSSALPVELIGFRGMEKMGRVVLNWEVEQMFHHSHFEIEHSTDGFRFEKISQEDAQKRFYQFVHLNPVAGWNYYQLKQVDLDGAFEYSKVISVPIRSSDFMTYHSGSRQLVFDYKIGNPDLLIYSIAGQLILKTPILDNFYPLDFLKKGVYIALAKTAGRMDTEKIIIL